MKRFVIFQEREARIDPAKVVSIVIAQSDDLQRAKEIATEEAARRNDDIFVAEVLGTCHPVYPVDTSWEPNI